MFYDKLLLCIWKHCIIQLIQQAPKEMLKFIHKTSKTNIMFEIQSMARIFR